MHVSYRDATLDDLPEIVAIYNSTIPSREVTADLTPVTVESRLPWFHEHGPGTWPLWVVENDEEAAAASGKRLAAWLSLSGFYGRPAYSRTAEISIYVDETASGRGLGTRLVELALDAGPALGIDTLVGFIFGHNAASLALFRRCGFHDWGLLPRVAVLDGVERDLAILGRRVSEASA